MINSYEEYIGYSYNSLYHKYVVNVVYCGDDFSFYTSPEMDLIVCYSHIIELLSRTALDNAYTINICKPDGEIYQRIYHKGVNLVV